MKIKNNKGFTLLEVLVAIFIFTTVIFIGYKIIDKSTIAVKDQGNINKGQLTMNDMNNYLTKDLEQATSIQLLLDSDGEDTDNYEIIADTKIEEGQDPEAKKNLLEEVFSSQIETKLNTNNSKFKYKYIIRNNTDSELDDNKYIATVKKEGKIIEHTVERIDKNGTKIEFINKDKTKEKILPIKITGNNPYKVNIGYMDKNNSFNKHEFEVTSRLSSIVAGDDSEEINPPKPDIPWIPIEPGKPIIPEPPEDLNPPLIDDKFDLDTLGCIGFWAADSSKKKEENLYVWHKMYSQGMESGGGEFATQSDLYLGNYYINSEVGIGNSNKKDNASIRDGNNQGAKVNISFQNHTLPDKFNVYLQVYVSGGVEFNITKLIHGDSNTYTPGTILKGEENGKVHELKYLGQGKDLNVSGTINLNGNSNGYVIIMYGNLKK
ncbi:MAG: PulJ/GspJ family protein [Romboutsia sp.]|uniref:PulJ/GspJ family protein n=1 Tax=Romboutsia sp. TaxID=1965302 RepID=UPI003F324410